MTQPVLGIDIAKETFDVALVIEGRTSHEQFENQAKGYEQMVKWMRKHTPEGVLACMEATGQYGDPLAEYLFAAGFQVSVINPARIKAYGASKLRRNKTDKADAELIAEYGLREQPALWTPPPASFKDLQALVRRLEDIQTNRQQENNRLKSGVSNSVVLEDLKAHLAYLDDQIKRLKQAIQNHIDAHPDLKQRQDLLITIPGIGELTAAKVLGEIRNVTEFTSARQLAAYAGVTPRVFISGTSVHKKSRLSKTGNANLRHILYMPAIVATRFNPIVKAFYSRLLSAGLKPMEAIAAAMHKLLHLIYGILKSGQPFDPDFLQKIQAAS
jgi:transposase